MTTTDDETPKFRLRHSRLNNTATRYLVAGGLSFLFDFGMLALLHVVFGWPTWLATGVAFVLSFVVTYTLQRLFAFASARPHGVTLVKYTALVVFNTIATVLIVSLLGHSWLNWEGGKVVATAITTVWNYFAYRYWVFPRGSNLPTVSPSES